MNDRDRQGARARGQHELEGIDLALALLCRKVRLLGAVTPNGAERERARLVSALEAGHPVAPRWTYAAADGGEARRLADEIAERIALAAPERDPLARLQLERARELGAEAALIDAIGTRRFGDLARARYRSEDGARGGLETLALADEWLGLQPEATGPTLASDDAGDPRSLLCRMRDEAARLGISVEVVASPSLASLAAIGEGRIWVAAGRPVTVQDVERTIVHELHGHALPRSRAARMPLGIFSVGTAKGADDQEGLALVLEERAGFLGASRKRELAGRHLAVRCMDGGAELVETAGALVARGFGAGEAVRMAERAYRGGDGRGAGLGRERIYVETYKKTRAHLERAPGDLAVLTSGQVAVAAVETLRPYVTRAGS